METVGHVPESPDSNSKDKKGHARGFLSAIGSISGVKEAVFGVQLATAFNPVEATTSLPTQEQTHAYQEHVPREIADSNTDGVIDNTDVESFIKKYFHAEHLSEVSDTGFVRGVFTFDDDSTLAFQGRPNVMRINPATKDILWTYGNFADAIKTIGQIRDIREDGMIFGKSGFARINTKTGKLLWINDDTRLANADGLYKTNGWIATNDTNAVRVDPDTGKIIWVLNFKENGISGLPSVMNETIQFNNYSSVGRIDYATGRVRWTIDVPKDTFGTLQSSELGLDGMIVGSTGALRLNMDTGKIMWVFDGVTELGISSKSIGKFISADGIMQNNSTGETARVDIDTGKTLWKRGDLPVRKKLFMSGFVHGSHGTRFITDKDDAAVVNNQGQVTFCTDEVSQETRAILRDLHIDYENRFYGHDFIEHVIRNRTLFDRGDIDKILEDGKTLTIVFFPKKDENGVFQLNNLDGFMQRSNVLYFEIGHEQELYQILKKLSTANINVPKRFIFAGHSTSDHMSFGEQDPARASGPLDETKMLDLSDQDELKDFKPLFRNAAIIAYGCEVGSQNKEGGNIVDFLSRLGTGVSAIGATVPITLYFQFDHSGEYRGVNFYVDGVEVPLRDIYQVTSSNK